MGTNVVVADAIEAEAWEDLYAAMPEPMRSELGLEARRVGDARVLLAPKIPSAMFNRAIGFGAEQTPTEKDLDALIDVFARAGAPFFIHVHDRTRDRSRVEQWLSARGLVLFSRPCWQKFLRRATPPPEVATSLVVREIGRAEAEPLARILVDAHKMPPPMLPWLAALVGRERWRSYGVFDGAAIVGGGMTYLRGDRAWLGMGGTAASHRGRGAQKAVMARRVADAIAAGATIIATETGEPVGDESNPSYRNMLWCGFERAGLRANWTRA